MIPLLLFLGGGFTLAIASAVYWFVQSRRIQQSARVQTPTLVFVRTWKPLSPDEWALAFRQWPDSDPRWRALWDMLAFYLEAELGEALGDKTDPHDIVRRNGRVQMLLFLRAQILNLRQS